MILAEHIDLSTVHVIASLYDSISAVKRVKKNTQAFSNVRVKFLVPVFKSGIPEQEKGI